MLNEFIQKQTLVATLCLAVTGLATAAEMPAPEAPTPEAPAPEEQRFDDWRLACGDDGCLAITRVTAADGTEVLRLEAGGTPRRLRFITPLGLHLPDGLAAAIGAETTRAIPWRTCAPDTGCLADAPLDPELLAALRREREGSVVLTLVEGVPVRLGISLMGFTAAWRALESGPAPAPEQ